MRNNLLVSSIFVFCFWWVILTFRAMFGADPIDWSPSIFVGNLSISGMSLLWGMAFASGAFLLSRYFIKAQLVGASKRGIIVNLGPFPASKKGLPRCTPRITPWQENMENWIKMYGKAYPEHMTLLEAIAQIIDAHPLHPASIEPGGHGDRTLLEHSHNVAEIMVKLSTSYQYRGLKLTGSNQTFEQTDPLFVFRHDDPLIPLVGLVHDLGKIECYEVTNEGVAIEKRSQHDWRGRFLLASIPEFWNLPDGDRNVLLDTVGFYHHSWDLPTNVADRPRALIDLVLQADSAAGELESKNPKMATAEDIYEMVRRMLIARGDDPEKAARPDRSVNYLTELGGVKLSLHQSRVLYYFEELIAEPDSVNGGDTDKRIAIKIGDTIYCDEERVRERLGRLLKAKRLIESTKGDGQKILTTRLMEVLALRGSLVNVVDGHEFGPGRSLFKLTARTTKDKNIREYVWPAVFMIKVNAYKEKKLDEISDVALEVVSVTPVYGWNQAKLKPTQKNVALAKPENTQDQKTEQPEKAGNATIDNDADDLPSEITGEAVVIEASHEGDHTEGVAKTLFEMGQEDLSVNIEATIDSAMVIPEKAPPSDKRKKRDRRRSSKEATDASSPANTRSWWEADDGQEMIYQLVALIREASVQVKPKEIDGVAYGMTKLVPAMKLLDIPVEGEQKVIALLHAAENFILRKNGEGENFVGVPQHVLENP